MIVNVMDIRQRAVKDFAFMLENPMSSLRNDCRPVRKYKATLTVRQVARKVVRQANLNMILRHALNMATSQGL